MKKANSNEVPESIGENGQVQVENNFINHFYTYVKNYLESIGETVSDEKILEGVDGFYNSMMSQIKENNEDNLYTFFAVGADKKQVPVFTVYYKKDDSFFTCEGEWDFDEE